MQLPPQEKLVAVALKHIFEQIKVIEEQENKEVQDIHQSFFAKYKTIEEKVSISLSSQQPSSVEHPYLLRIFKIQTNILHQLKNQKQNSWQRIIKELRTTGS